jgi:hypothetical protein
MYRRLNLLCRYSSDCDNYYYGFWSDGVIEVLYISTGYENRMAICINCYS